LVFLKEYLCAFQRTGSRGKHLHMAPGSFVANAVWPGWLTAVAWVGKGVMAWNSGNFPHSSELARREGEQDWFSLHQVGETNGALSDEQGRPGSVR